jgi:hypothetical protein
MSTAAALQRANGSAGVERGGHSAERTGLGRNQSPEQRSRPRRGGAAGPRAHPCARGATDSERRPGRLGSESQAAPPSWHAHVSRETWRCRQAHAFRSRPLRHSASSAKRGRPPPTLVADRSTRELGEFHARARLARPKPPPTTHAWRAPRVRRPMMSSPQPHAPASTNRGPRGHDVRSVRPMRGRRAIEDRADSGCEE